VLRATEEEDETMFDDTDPVSKAPADDDDEDLPDEESVELLEPDEDEDEPPLPGELTFCELCGTSEDDDDELLRCEECGRLVCTACREYDEEGTPYCTECFDEIVEP
jgi:hypothetical protein